MANWGKQFRELLPPLVKTGEGAGVKGDTHIAYWVLWADLVTSPAPAALLSTDLMTPQLQSVSVTNSQMTQRKIVGAALNTQALKNHFNHGSITRYQDFQAIFQLLTRMMANLLLQLSKPVTRGVKLMFTGATSASWLPSKGQM